MMSSKLKYALAAGALFMGGIPPRLLLRRQLQNEISAALRTAGAADGGRGAFVQSPDVLERI